MSTVQVGLVAVTWRRCPGCPGTWFGSRQGAQTAQRNVELQSMGLQEGVGICADSARPWTVSMKMLMKMEDICGDGPVLLDRPDHSSQHAARALRW
jgi:hypothetical protein